MLLWLLAACGGDDDPPQASDDDDDDDDVTLPTGDSGLGDVDGDGFVQDDCAPYDPLVNPDAAESWNNEDDDCDGVVDANTTFTTDAFVVSGVAIFMGQPVPLSVTCPAELTRANTVVDFTITCTPDPGDADAQQFLGAGLTLTAGDGFTDESTWSGPVDFASTDGWHASGTATATWTSFHDVVVSVDLDTFSLQLAGTKGLSR